MKSNSNLIRNLAILFGLVIIAIVVVQRSGSINGIWDVLKSTRLDRLLLGVLVFLLTFVLSGLNYLLLAKTPQRFGNLIAVQAAGGFANKLMPAGLGSMTLSARYLLHHGHNVSQAVAVASTNNMIGVFGHLILLAFAMPSLTQGPLPITVNNSINAYHLLIIGSVFSLGIFIIFKNWGKKLVRIIKQSIKQIREYQKQPGTLFIALIISICITGAYSVILQACVQAVGTHILPSEALLAISAGLMGTSVMPTPGGAGGAEAGIALVLSGFGLPVTLAISSALIYRLLTFWLPFLPGFFVFEWLQLKRQLF